VVQEEKEEERPHRRASRPSRGSRWRPIRTSVGLLLSLALLYLVAANLILSTSLHERIVNVRQDVIDLHFERGWSILPGRIHARNVSLRGRDGSVEWILRLDQVEFDLSFLALARRQFDASRVRSKGMTFRLRRRLDSPPTSQEEVSTLPPIDGLPPYSVRPPPEPSPQEWSDSGYNLWMAHVEDIVADDVREVWIDHARFEGRAHIDGGFLFKPMRAVEVGPVHVAIERGAVRTGEAPIADALDGSVVDGTLTRIDPRTTTGATFLHHLSLATKAHAVLPDLTRLSPLLGRGGGVEGAAEVRQAFLYVKSGVLEKGSKLDVAATRAVLSLGAYRVAGELALEADVTPTPENPSGRLFFRAEMTNLEAHHGLDAHGAPSLLLRAPRAAAAGDAGMLDMATPFADLHFSVDLPAGELPDAHALSVYIPSKTPLAVVGGRAQAQARVEAWLSERRAAGSAVLRAQDLDLRLAKLRIRGETAVTGEFAAYRFDTRRLEGARVAIETSKAVLASDAAPGTPLVRVTSKSQLTARQPVVDLADPLRGLDVEIAIPEADVVSRGLLRAYLPKGEDMQIVGSRSRFSLKCSIVIADHLARGSLDVEARNLTIDHRKLRLDAGIRAHAGVHDWQWESGHLALDRANVDIAHITIAKQGGGGSAPPAASLARIGLSAESPRFELTDPLAHVSLYLSLADGRVRDATVLDDFLPDKATFGLEGTQGAFGAEVRIEVEDHVARGDVHGHASRMGVGGRTIHVGGDIDFRANVADWDFRKSTMKRADFRVAITRVGGRFGEQGPPTFSANRIALAARANDFGLRAPSLRGADFRLIVDKAQLPDARALGALIPEGAALRIESGAVNVAADLAVSGSTSTASGSVDVALARMGVLFHETRLSGDFHVVAGIRGFDPQHERLELADTRFEMRNVAVREASATTSQWRGDLTLSSASLQLAPELRLDGVIGLDAQDAKPILALFLGKKFPKILVGLIDMPRLLASAQLTVGKQEASLLNVEARGGDVTLRGNYAVRDRRRRGALVVRKGPLSVGLGLDDRGTHPRLFGLEGWLRRETRAVRELLTP
jgi:hypothetical protein